MIVDSSSSSLSSPCSDTSFLSSPESLNNQMSPSERSSVNCTPFPTVHKDFYLQDSNITFLVENTYFKVDRFFFQRDSHIFRAIFKRTPSRKCSEAIPLWGITTLDFERFLRVLYPTDFTKHNATTVDEWTSILDISARWAFKSVHALAIKELTLLASPIDKIVLGRKYHVTEWLREAYRAVCERDYILTIEEGKRLGMPEVLKIWHASRAIRQDATLVAPHHLYSIIEETFELDIVPVAQGPPEEDALLKDSDEREFEDEADRIVEYHSGGRQDSVYGGSVEECGNIEDELLNPAELCDIFDSRPSTCLGLSPPSYADKAANIIKPRSDLSGAETILSTGTTHDPAYSDNFLFPNKNSGGNVKKPRRKCRRREKNQQLDLARAAAVLTPSPGVYIIPQARQ